jgi:hypothetical protein
MKNSTLWWTSMATGKRWSREEQWTRGAIYIIAVLLFLALEALETWIMRQYQMEENSRMLIGTITCVPIAMFVSRRICVWAWPDYVKKADETAAKRLGDRI